MTNATTYVAMKPSMLTTAATALALLAASSGCYNTVVMSGAPPAGPEIEERQWFTIGGLLPLSSPAGAMCGPAGLSKAESRMSGVDILIDVGLSLAGAIVGASVCNLPANPSDSEVNTYTTCVGGLGALVPFLFATRTVRYTCAGR